jgi:predicted SAM-dependent methyltransferase
MSALMDYFNRKTVSLVKKNVPYEIRIFFRKVRWKIQYYKQYIFAHPVANVYCPVAEWEFKMFIQRGNDLLTPSNGAKRRQRLVWLYLKQEVNILSGKQLKILHIAPELPYLEILRKQKNLTYVPGDKMVEGYSNQKGINNIDLTQLVYDDNVFDCIICNHVLEHIPNDIRAMSEMFRTLKNGGIAVITVPIDEKRDKTLEDQSIRSPQERKKYYGQWDHLRLYGMDIKERLESVGFTVELNRYGNNFSETDFKKYGLCYDPIIVAKKLR